MPFTFAYLTSDRKTQPDDNARFNTSRIRLNSWPKLRAEHPGKYEQPVNPVPDPNDWFHARVVVAHPKVSVFVSEAKEPCLEVTQLSDRKKGLVGLWGGNGSGGDFANLKIVPA
jgi:hypothetical protein